MVAYFRLQNNLLMLGGAALGALIAMFGIGGIGGSQVIFVRLFYILMFTICGVVLGRLLSSIVATKRISGLNALLYQHCNPQAFLDRFLPLVAAVPSQAAESVDGRCKVAFAYEALGEMDKGLAVMEEVRLADLKLHVLQCTALVANQTLRLHLLKGDAEAAEKQLGALEELQEVSVKRAPTLGKQLGECVRLGKNWLKVLRDEECDLDYLREEVRLSGNMIYKAEMLLLLAQALENEGLELDAREAYVEAAQLVPDLYAGKRAKMALGME